MCGAVRVVGSDTIVIQMRLVFHTNPYIFKLNWGDDSGDKWTFCAEPYSIFGKWPEIEVKLSEKEWVGKSRNGVKGVSNPN